MVFHKGGLSSPWSFIRVVYHQAFHSTPFLSQVRTQHQKLTEHCPHPQDRSCRKGVGPFTGIHKGQGFREEKKTFEMRDGLSSGWSHQEFHKAPSLSQVSTQHQKLKEQCPYPQDRSCRSLVPAHSDRSQGHSGLGWHCWSGSSDPQGTGKHRGWGPFGQVGSSSLHNK